MTSDPLSGLVSCPEPGRLDGLGRAVGEGAWTGAAAGPLALVTSTGTLSDGTSLDVTIGIMIGGVPFAAGIGAVLGATGALAAAGAVLALPPGLRPANRRGLAGPVSWP